jgi:hypothetical protein
MDASRAKVEAAAGRRPLRPLGCPAAVRARPLGEDREGRLFWQLQCAGALAGASLAASFPRQCCLLPLRMSGTASPSAHEHTRMSPCQ